MMRDGIAVRRFANVAELLPPLLAEAEVVDGRGGEELFIF
jgi:hypothetical protein